MANPGEVSGVPLSVTEQDFLTFNEVPADLNRAIVPLFEMSQDSDSPTVAAIGTAFVIGKTPTGETLFVTAGHNIPDAYGGGETNLVVVLPKKGGVTGLQGFTVSGVSIAESS